MKISQINVSLFNLTIFIKSIKFIKNYYILIYQNYNINNMNTYHECIITNLKNIKIYYSDKKNYF